MENSLDLNRPIPVVDIPTRWYVVSNRTNTVFYSEGSDHEFNFVNRFLNLEGRLKEGELDSDKPGRGFSSAGGGTIRHALDRTFDHTEGSAVKFTHRIVKSLEKAMAENRFDELVLVAEPHFLGLLKDSLSEPLKKKLKGTVAKEYVYQSDAKELRGLILKAMKNP